jgi:short-subunit dehydrogenase
MSSKNLLIIGGNSSLSTPVMNLAKEKGYEVTITLREDDINNSEEVNRISLNLNLKGEPHDFLKKIHNETYSVILFLIGETSLSYLDKNKYIKIHLSKTLTLIETLQKNNLKTNDSCLIYMSSRAAIHPSFDPYYSAVKGGMISAIRSLALRSKPNQYIISVVSGLIRGSRMFEDMPQHLQLSHAERAAQNLLTKEEYAFKLFEVIENLELCKNGEYILIGSDYE